MTDGSVAAICNTMWQSAPVVSLAPHRGHHAIVRPPFFAITALFPQDPTMASRYGLQGMPTMPLIVIAQDAVMDVTNAPAASTASVASSKRKDPDAKAAGSSDTPSKTSAAASSKVSLSSAAKAAHETEQAHAAKSVDKASGSTVGVKSANDAAASEEKKAENAAADAKDGSALKSLAYGTLGLQSPEEAKENTDSWYSAGKWVGAAITVGGIVSLLL